MDAVLLEHDYEMIVDGVPVIWEPYSDVLVGRLDPSKIGGPALDEFDDSIDPLLVLRSIW